MITTRADAVTRASDLRTTQQIRKWSWAEIAILGGVALGLMYLASLRAIGGYGVETDFYGSFVSDARHFLAGEPLAVEWQPPFYSILLSVLYAAVGDWFRAGVIISVCSALIALAAAYRLFANLLGPRYGVAAALSLLIWPDFVVSSVTASADMLFLALMLGSLATASTSSGSVLGRGVLSGALAGVASLTRTNGFVLLLLPLFYASRYPREGKPRAALTALCGFLLPWGFWVLTSAITDSPVYPSRNYIDLAVNFFGPDGHRESSNSENWSYAEANFSSLRDVLTHDPVTLVKGVLRNALTHGWSLFRIVSPVLPPIAAIAAGSFLYLIVMRRDPSLWVLCSILAAQYGVLCLRSFGSRYFLFLIPAVGAGVFGALELASRKILRTEMVRPIAVVVIFVLLLAMRPYAAKQLFYSLEQGKDALAAADVMARIPNLEGRVVARKPHLSFRMGLDSMTLPAVATLNDLGRELCSGQAQRTFLFFGEAEAAARPQLRTLLGPHPADWLLPLGHGQSSLSAWTLHEVRCAREVTR